MDIISLNLINSASMVFIRIQQVYVVPFSMIKPFRLAIGHGMQKIHKFIQKRSTNKSNNSLWVHN
jgi:hypothetical protein